MAEPSDRVTVVVPTRNVIRTIEACLASLRRQVPSGVEVVVVDNSSDDGTVEVAKRLADIVATGGPERSAQRNQGVELASGDWVMWIDSDMVLPPETIAAALATAAATSADAVSVPELSIGEGFWTACRRLERTCYLDDPSMYYPRMLRRSTLLSVGGFDASMAGPEDVDLRLRLDAAGARLAHCATVHILHDEGRLTLRAIVRKRIYYGRSLPAFSAAHPGALGTQGSSTARAFLRHWRRLAAQPLLLGGIFVMRLVEAVAYGVGYAQGSRALRRSPAAPRA